MASPLIFWSVSQSAATYLAIQSFPLGYSISYIISYLLIDALPFIVKNEGNILFGDGVPVGLYGINDELSLIISQVRNSSAGTYYCRLAPQRLAFQDASVPIEVIGMSVSL